MPIFLKMWEKNVSMMVVVIFLLSMSPFCLSKGDVLALKEDPLVWSSILDLGGCCCVFWRKKRRGKWVEREWRNWGLQQLRLLWPSLASPLASTSHDGCVFLSFPLDTSCIRWNVLQLAGS